MMAFWEKMQEVMNGFKSWCGLSYVQGTIDGMHISISKPFGPFCENIMEYKEYIPPYVLRDNGYLLLSWLMTPNRKGDMNLLK